MSFLKDIIDKQRLKKCLELLKSHVATSVNGQKPDKNGAVNIGIGVESVDGITPDEAGNVKIPVASDEEVAAGETNEKYMTPANTLFAINKRTANYYNSVEAMKADRKLKAGMTACTLGYYAINDGGGATYIIRAKQESDVDDGGSLHELVSGLVAELVVENGTVNVKQFGAKGDGVTDDSLKINQCLNTFKSIVLPSGTYLTEQTIMLNPGQVIKGQYDNSVIETRAAIAFDVNSQCKLCDFKVVIKQNGVNTVFLVDEKSIDNQLTNSSQDNIVFDNIIVQTLKFEVSPSFTVFEIKNESENKGMYGIIINKIKALCNHQKYFCRAYTKNPAWLSTVTFSDCYLAGFEWFYFMAKSDDFSNNNGYSGCAGIIIHDNCIQPVYNYSKAFIYLLNTTAELNGNVIWDTSKLTYSGKPYFINRDFLQNKQVFTGSQSIESWQCVSENNGVFKEMSYAQAQYNAHLQPASDTKRYPLGIPRGSMSVKGTLIFKGNFPAADILLMFWIANRYGLFPVMIKNDKWYSSANLSKEITFGYKVIDGKRLIYAVTPIGASNQTTTMFIPLPITNTIASAGADVMQASTNHVFTINLVEQNSYKIVDEAELYYLEQPNDLTMLDFELNPNYAAPPSNLTSIS